MKTFQEFQKDLHEVAPALLAAPLVLPALTFAAGAAANILKAKRQGEGGRSQPVDYGQGGTTKPRTPNVQRGRLSANDAYNKQKKEERKAEAQRRAREKAEQGIDSLIGSDAERKAAAQARANQPQIQKELRRKAMRERMRKAAERNNIPEAYSRAERQSHTTTPFEIKKERESGKEYPYKVAPLTKQQKDIHYTTPVYPTQLPNKKDKPVWKDKEFQYPGMPIKDLLRGGTTL